MVWTLPFFLFELVTAVFLIIITLPTTDWVFVDVKLTFPWIHGIPAPSTLWDHVQTDSLLPRCFLN